MTEYEKNAYLADKYFKPFKDKPIRALVHCVEGPERNIFDNSVTFCFEILTPSDMRARMNGIEENEEYDNFGYTSYLELSESEYIENDLIKNLEINKYVWCEISSTEKDDNKILKMDLEFSGRTDKNCLDKYGIKEITPAVLKEIVPTKEELEIQKNFDDFVNKTLLELNESIFKNLGFCI